LQSKYYPFLYDNFGFTENETNAVQVIENYSQREMTVILTNEHLLAQMKNYITKDFIHNLLDNTDIQIVSNVLEATISKAHILILPATQQNSDVLVQLSYEAPFMRIIIDDFTSMVGIDSFRQFNNFCFRLWI
jgi:hypothetical protein